MITTPYDRIIDDLEKITGQAGFGETKRQLIYWQACQNAFRLGYEDQRKTELEMVPVESEGFKGEHTGRAKLEIWPDHDPKLGGMCLCRWCAQSFHTEIV